MKTPQSECTKASLKWAAFGAIATVVNYGLTFLLLAIPLGIFAFVIVGPVMSVICWPMTLVMSLAGYVDALPYFGHGPEAIGYRLGFFFKLFPIALLVNAGGYAVCGWGVGLLKAVGGEGVKQHRRKVLFLAVCVSLVILGLVLHIPIIRTTAVVLLKTDNLALRREAAYVMYWLGPRCAPARADLLSAANDPDSGVRYNIARAAGKCNGEDPVLISILTNALEDASVPVRCEAAQALFRHEKQIRPAILAMVHTAASATEPDRHRVERTLRFLPHELRKDDARVVVDAINALEDGEARTRVKNALGYNWTILEMLEHTR